LILAAAQIVACLPCTVKFFAAVMQKNGVLLQAALDHTKTFV
jgi:hypothetical protein